jgi:uncharacterized Zn-binding protein involved in type VI secretion
MPSVARMSDAVMSPDGTGYKCRVPITTSLAAGNYANVTANFLPIAVNGSPVTPHLRAPCIPDISFVSCFRTVTIAGSPVATIGDSASDNILVQGSPNVFVGL